MSWRKTITKAEDSGSSWRKTIQSAPEDVSMVESALRGAAQGASLGFADEITGGLESLLTDKSYEQARDESRANYKQAETANPVTFGAGNVAGAVGTSLIVPGMAGAASVAGRAAQAAAGGALSGLGQSEATDATGMAKDAALGAGLGAGLSTIGDKVVAPAIRKVGEYADDALQAVSKKSPVINQALAKGAKFFTGVDDDAAKRQLERPLQASAAEADGFAFETGKKAVAETEERGALLGQNVAAEEAKLVKEFRPEVFSGDELVGKIDEFLDGHSPSAMGFSGIDETQRAELKMLSDKLRGQVLFSDDLVKFRKYMDHVERLAGKYDQEGLSPYVNFLKSLRGHADGMLDNTYKDFDAANKAFSQFKGDTGLLRSATNEGRAESMISNLYGANKGAQQEAAGRLFKPDTLDAAKDIAANKAFENAKRPGGDNYFRRGALAVLTTGVSEAVTSPRIWQQGLRYTGKLEQIIKGNPQLLGKYAGALTTAMERGPQAFAATHFILSQRDPQYRQTVESLEKDPAK
jgi:hypothetical protein